MWIFTRESFLSVAQHPDDPRLVVVHASIEGDIERIFPGVEVGERMDRDHRYSATIPIERMMQALLNEMKKINYPELHYAVEDLPRWQAYINVWVTMYEEQQRRQDVLADRAQKRKVFDLDA